MKTTDVQNDAETKQPYSAPELTVFGDVRVVTQGKSFGSNDMGPYLQATNTGS